MRPRLDTDGIPGAWLPGEDFEAEEHVAKQLQGPRTHAELVEGSGLEPRQVTNALQRLSDQHRAVFAEGRWHPTQGRRHPYGPSSF